MTEQEAQAIRQEALTWVKSNAFNEYFNNAHTTPAVMTVGSILVTLKLRNPFKWRREMREQGLADDALRQKYVQLVEQGSLCFSSVFMANSALLRGGVNAAPALLVSGNGLTEQDFDHLQRVLMVLNDLPDQPENPKLAAVAAMLADEAFCFGRTRQLPLDMTDGQPMYLVDTFLQRDALMSGSGEPLPALFTFVQPDGKPSVLPLPLNIYASVFSGSATEPDTKGQMMAFTPSDDDDMQAAIAKARETLPDFWRAYATRDQGESDFTLKIPIHDGDEVEFFWVTELERRDGKVSGRLGNDPVVVSGVQEGDTVEVAEDQISDWMYLIDGKIHGNRTLRASLPHMDPTEVAQIEPLIATERDF